MTYTYDYRGNMIREGAGATAASQTYTYTVYDGENPYLQVTDPKALANPGTNTTASVSQRYLYGPAVDQSTWPRTRGGTYCGGCRTTKGRFATW